MMIKRILLLTFIAMVLLPLHASAQQQPNWDYLLHEAKRGDVTLATRYYKVNVWSVKTSTALPRHSANWTLSNFSAPLDAKQKKIDFGKKADRYLMFTQEWNDQKFPGGLRGVINEHGSTPQALKARTLRLVLNLYEYNGTFVRTVSRYGTLIGNAGQGFVYLPEGKKPLFFTGEFFAPGDSLTYWNPDDKMTEAWFYGEDYTTLVENCYSKHSAKILEEAKADVKKMEERSAQYAKPLPVYTGAKAELLEKIRNNSKFLAQKFSAKMAWDSALHPTGLSPIPKKPWNLMNIAKCLDIGTKTPLDWGPNGDRYLQFDLVFSPKMAPGALKDDMFGSNESFMLVLCLYEKDGTYVRTVSKYGGFMGFASGYFFYNQENTYGTLFTNKPIPLQKFANWNLNEPNIPTIDYYTPWAPWGRQLTYTPDNGMIKPVLSDILNRTL
jgi:hypothetical protein